GDRRRLAVGKILRTVATLQQEALALLGFGQLLLEREDFPRGDQRRQLPQLAQRSLQRRGIRVGRHLQRWLATPTVWRPAGVRSGRNGWSRREVHAITSNSTGKVGADQCKKRRKPAYSAHSASSTNHTRLHIGMLRPRKVQSILPQSPVPVSTVRNTSSGPIVSLRKLNGGPQLLPISFGSIDRKSGV